LLLTIDLLLLSEPPCIRRRKIICPRRVSKGGCEFVDGITWGVVTTFVISSRARELRRRLGFDERQKVQVEGIRVRRRRFFVDIVVLVVDDADEIGFIFDLVRCVR